MTIGPSLLVANQHDGAFRDFSSVGGAAFHVWLAHYLGPLLTAVGQRCTVPRIPLPSSTSLPIRQYQREAGWSACIGTATSTHFLRSGYTGHRTGTRLGRLAVRLCPVGGHKPSVETYHQLVSPD